MYLKWIFRELKLGVNKKKYDKGESERLKAAYEITKLLVALFSAMFINDKYEITSQYEEELGNLSRFDREFEFNRTYI